jgi:hypothetical protein
MRSMVQHYDAKRSLMWELLLRKHAGSSDLREWGPGMQLVKFRERETALPLIARNQKLPFQTSDHSRMTGAGAICVLVVVTFLAVSVPVRGQCAAHKSASELLRAVVESELNAEASDHTHWRYQVKTLRAGKEKEQVKVVIETSEGDIDRLRSVDGKALTSQAEKQEEKRIQNLVHNPEALRKFRRAQQEDARRTEQMFRILPNAVTVTCGEHRGNLVEITFRPNPDFHPSSHEASVFHDMEGRIWVNDRDNRLAEIDGKLVKNVEFGGGLLGHLDKGGEFHVKQSELAPGHWGIILLHVDMHGRALFFKTIGVQQNEERTNFQQLPDSLTPAQAAQELVK